MILICVCIGIAYLEFAESAVLGCATLSEENVKMIQKLSENMETLADRNQQFKQQQLRKVLDGFDESSSKMLKIDDNDSLESVLLQHQLLLHQDIKEMFAEIKAFYSRQRRSVAATSVNDYSEKREDLIKEDKSKGNSELSTSDSAKRSEFYAPTDSAFRPTDCSELLVSGHTESGIYYIFPFKCHCTKPVKVFCDMETNGGGWTIFLLRANVSKSENFTRNWEAYKNGFGFLEKEYWLGNEALHTMTVNRNYVLRMEAKDSGGREIWGEWSSIVVHSEIEKYKLVVTGHDAKSTAVDRFAYVTNGFFSTFDSDNDKHSTLNCAQSYRGGWWHNACVHNNPTGEYGKTGTEGITINPWSKTDKAVRNAAWLQLKIRPHICSSQVSVIQLNKHNCVFN